LIIREISPAVSSTYAPIGAPVLFAEMLEIDGMTK